MKCQRFNCSDYTAMMLTSGIFTIIIATVSIGFSYSTTDFGPMDYFLLGAAIALLFNIMISGTSTCLISLFQSNRVGNEEDLSQSNETGNQEDRGAIN